MKSLYETFGNEVRYEDRRGKLVQFLENSTIAFPLPEASVDILTSMLSDKFTGMDPNKIDVIYSKLMTVGFNKATAKTLAVALIEVAKRQGVHPMAYFEMNDESIKLAEATYKALNSIRPKGNLVGLTTIKSNRKSLIANTIRP
jgi:hypothetical protein